MDYVNFVPNSWRQIDQIKLEKMYRKIELQRKLIIYFSMNIQQNISNCQQEV
jgi:hypothetical protein